MGSLEVEASDLGRRIFFRGRPAFSHASKQLLCRCVPTCCHALLAWSCEMTLPHGTQYKAFARLVGSRGAYTPKSLTCRHRCHTVTLLTLFSPSGFAGSRTFFLGGSPLGRSPLGGSSLSTFSSAPSSSKSSSSKKRKQKRKKTQKRRRHFKKKSQKKRKKIKRKRLKRKKCGKKGDDGESGSGGI